MMKTSILYRRSRNYRSFKAISVIVRYSVLVLERETTSWRLLRQAMREEPKKMQKPVVERHMSGSSVHSASVLDRRESDKLKCIAMIEK